MHSFVTLYDKNSFFITFPEGGGRFLVNNYDIRFIEYRSLRLCL